MTGTPDAGDRDTLTKTERTLWFRVLADYKRGWVNTAYVADAMEQIVAGRVRAAQAQAWDECWEAVVGGSEVYVGAYIPNPYRSDPVDEFQDSED